METSKWDKAYLNDSKSLESWLYGSQSLQGATRSWLITWLKDHLGKTFLDAGCGGGVTAYHLGQNKMLTKFAYTGVDSSEAMLELAKRKVKGPAKWVQMDLNELALQRKFDIVLLRAILAHVNDPKPVLEKVCEHVAENGYLIVLFWNNPAQGETIFGTSSIHTPDNAHSENALKQIIDDADMRIYESFKIDEPAARDQNYRTIWLIRHK